MKNIYGYIYWNVCMRLLPATAIVIAVSIYMKYYILIAVWFLFLLFGYQYPAKGIKALQRRGVDILDIRRDFVYARKCGPVTVGSNYMYIWNGLKLDIIPADHIAGINGINQTVTTIYSHERVKHKYMYVQVRTTEGKQYKKSISKSNLDIFINEIRRRGLA